jgi:1,4-dihydroxy-2-naphthoate octaprenyltransferase
LPQTFIIANQVRSGATGPALIPLLGKTGELQIIFAFLLALALVMH